MSEMVPFGGGLAKRESRAVSREVARLDAQGQLEIASCRYGRKEA